MRFVYIFGFDFVLGSRNTRNVRKKAEMLAAVAACSGVLRATWHIRANTCHTEERGTTSEVWGVSQRSGL